MKKRPFTLLILLYLLLSSNLWGQKASVYAFARAPQLLNYNFKTDKANYSEGVSAGLGLYYKSKFFELGSVILEGDTYGYYTLLGATVKSNGLGNLFKINTNVFGEVTTLPAKDDTEDDIWIYTGSICLAPNVQIDNINIGLAICTGISYKDNSILSNNRFVLNLSYKLF